MARSLNVLLAATAALTLAACAPTGSPPTSSSTDTSAAPWAAEGFIDASSEVILQWGKDDGVDSIFSQLADGSDRALAVELDGPALHPDVSPDGTKIAFRYSDPTDQIWVANADGSDAAVLVPCDEGTCFALPGVVSRRVEHRVRGLRAAAG